MSDPKPTVEQRLDEILVEVKKLKCESAVNHKTTYWILAIGLSAI